ncbi:MAG: phosphate-starvation-inducible PsiE family protein [Bacteroidota bacterium]|jgi:uncharacterized membrane protein (DUF373 family)
MEKNFMHWLKKVARFTILSLSVVLVVSMVLGTADLILEDVILKVISKDPYPMLIKTEELYSIFSMVLIIIVGYELFKSLYIIMYSNQMPVKSILKVAGMAMANKMITLNLKEVAPIELFGIAALIIGIGVAYYLFHKDPEIKE